MNIIGFGNCGTDFEDVKCSCTKYCNLKTKPDAFFVFKELVIEIMKKKEILQKKIAEFLLEKKIMKK